MLVKDGVVFKPYQKAGAGRSASRGELEVQFYEDVASSGHPLGAFMPNYYGVETMPDGSAYLKLEDVTAGMSKP